MAPKLSDYDAQLQALREVFPTADISLGLTDHEEDDEGNVLPQRVVLIINAQLHGSRNVPDPSALSAVAHDLITDLLRGA